MPKAAALRSDLIFVSGSFWRWGIKGHLSGQKRLPFSYQLKFRSKPDEPAIAPPQVTLIRLMSAEQLKIRKPRGAALHLEPEILNFKKQFKGGLNYES
ncbi:MAG: hypothetical protein ACP5SQ_05985 [Candidatus Saccharicenans sp.]